MNSQDLGGKETAEEEGKVIAIASGKGGTGKTVSTLNIGMVLHNLGKNVMIVDADLEDPNVGVNLGIYSPQVTLNEILEGEKNILEALYIHETGLRVIPASLSINYMNTNVRAMSELIKEIGGYVVIDCGPGVNQNVRSSFEIADSIIVVTNPMRSSISGAIRVIELAKDMSKEIEGLIVNNLTSREVSNEEIKHITGCPILGEIPYDAQVDEGIVNKTPVVEHKPYSRASESFREIAHNLVDKEYNKPWHSFFRRVWSKLNTKLNSIL